MRDMRDERLEIKIRCERDRAILTLEGELDLLGAEVLKSAMEALETSVAKSVVLDLRQLSFLDSTGLRTLLAARSQASERGQGFAVTEGGEQVVRLLCLTGVGDELNVIASPDAALA